MIWLIAILLLIPQQTRLDPIAVAERVQGVYEQARSIRCDFRQYQISGTTGMVVSESGELFLKVPGRMRWQYEEPERKLYVCDGETVHWYLPEDRQVTVMRLAEAGSQQTPILFLMGRGDLARDFEVTEDGATEPLYEDSYVLRLIPRSEEAFDYLVLEVLPRDFLVVRLMVVDPFGSTTEYRFSNIRPAEIDDGYFEFEIPRGVEVFEGQ